MTITSPKIIAKMLQNNGGYPGDPQAESIYKFKTPEGKQAFSVFLPGVPQDIYMSPYVIDPIAEAQ